MNVSTIESVIRMVLPVLAGLMFVITLVLALVGFGKWSRARLKAAVRKYSPFAVGFFLVWGALLADSQNVTQEEKEDAIEQEEDDEEENAVLGGLLLGSPRLMDFRGGLCGFESGGPEPAAAEEPVEIWGLAAEAAPSVLAPTDSDYAAGLALTAIGTGEAFDFTPPEGASVYEPWMRFGAARHWFRLGIGDWGLGNSEEEVTFPLGTNDVDALTVFSDGLLRLRTKDAGTFLAPLHADLCLVPAYWWNDLGEEASPSRFWTYRTPSGGMLFTWENALFGRNPTNAVSFQVEIAADGSVDFRYDLSRLDASDLTNLVVGVGSGSSGRVFTELQPGTTSLKWRRLDPMRADDPDPDGDGITTADEIVLCQTDPYNADTDRDGLSDYDEVNVAHSDPTDPHSVNPAYPDGFAVILGEENPFSYPEGSTNTVLEHIFYTGTTNAPFAYPVSSESIAVLEVTAYGVGSGELVIGDTVVPLVPRPRPRLLMGAFGGAADDPTATTLHVPVQKGVIRHCVLRVPDSLEVEVSSADYVYGRRPTWAWPHGWFAFPKTAASVPCIHDLNSRKVAVSLDPGFAAEGLTCTWNPTGSVDVRRTGGLSAELTGRFSPNATTPITYTLGHPLYICGETNYTQTVRFCPQINEEDLPEGEGHAGDDDVDIEDYECDCGNCHDVWCPCSCHFYVGLPDKDVCPIHLCPYGQCEIAHFVAYTNALSKPIAPDVLKLDRDPDDVDEIVLDVPDGVDFCCPCAEHRTNKVSVAYKSFNLSVRAEDGSRFSETAENCTIRVRALSPSREVGDSSLLLCKTGTVYEAHHYTALGMRIDHTYWDLKALNRVCPDAGLPVPVKGSLAYATTLRLRTDVRLSEGNVHIGFSNSAPGFKLYIQYAGEELLLLDTSEKSSLDVPISKWRQIMADHDDFRDVYVTLVAEHEGSADMEFGFSLERDGRCISDVSVQRVSAVRSPLIADYDHDGAISSADRVHVENGDPFRFWCNEDYISGDQVHGCERSVPNCSDQVVNGVWDLVNLFPVAIDMSGLTNLWGHSALTYKIGGSSPGSTLNVTFAEVRWDDLRSVQTNAVETFDGDVLSSANLTALAYEDIRIERDDFVRFGSGTGVMIAESTGWDTDAVALKAFIGDREVFRFCLPLVVTPVRCMYRWINARSNAGLRTTDLGVPYNSPYVRDGGKSLILLHGVNVSESASEKWGDWIFKRFWHSGFQGNFYFFSWESDIGLTGANYQENVSNAFVTASRMAQTVKDIPGEKVMMAHSLGNMVVSSMIQDYGLVPSSYIMCDSAVPAEAFDSTVEGTNVLVHSEWVDYPTNTWTKSWYSHFPVGDDRRKLTWRGRFADVVQYACNFYSSGDHVLELFHNNEPGVFDYDGDDQAFEQYSWHKQDLWKGRASVTEGLGGTSWSGWGFAKNGFGVRKYSVTDAISMSRTPEVLKTNTVFNAQPDSMCTNEIPRLVVDAHLAQGIPAWAPATGRVDLWESLRVRSFNMNDTDGTGNGIPRPHGWPTFSIWGERWLHSDIKDRAFWYVYKFYEKVMEVGGLQ